MEFSVANCQPAAFFPISIQFTSPKPFCDIAITEARYAICIRVSCLYTPATCNAGQAAVASSWAQVSNAANNQPIKYSKVVGLAVEDFQIA